MMRLKTIIGMVFILQVVLGLLPVDNATAENKPTDGPLSPLARISATLAEGFDYTIRMQTSATTQSPADSSQNPGNAFLNLARHQLKAELRPDFYLKMSRLTLSLKPRANLIWQAWEEGPISGSSDTSDRFFINEWLMRLGLTDTLFVSYGRENLQWGPSYLLSPSNPFFSDNGRSNPSQEVAGIDFLRLVWLPSEGWSISLISSLNHGEQENIFGDLEKIHALKIDYDGTSHYASLIFSHTESDRPRLGAYSGWTVSDALLLYAEGVMSQGSPALYAQGNSSPLGGTMTALKDDSSTLEGTILAGGSYTFASGPTLTFEYVHNTLGYTGSEDDAYIKLRQNAAAAMGQPGMIGSLAQLTLSQTLATGLRLRRQNYLMLQYRQTEISGLMDITGRYTHNLDDGSGQAVLMVDYYWGDHVQLFSVASVSTGGRGTEFKSLLDYQWMVGLTYTY